MPAMLEDPSAPIFYRQSGPPPYPGVFAPLPHEIGPHQVTLRDRITVATVIPFSSPAQVPHTLLAYLSDQLNREIELGDTYPMIEPIPLANFGPYWFGNFGAVMLLGNIESAEQVAQMEREGKDWERECLGSFYIKPNYPGRSSHVCNGGFLVTDAARNRGVGRLMGERYVDWAPRLGYSYSVFNLVYETNVASCRIWDALGFKRIGRVKGCGNLRSHPSQLIDAIIFGRDLGPEGEDFVSEERFDKIRYYLKHGKYPNGADRAEKSRLRSAATHYKLMPPVNGGDGPERLMLKDKEVVSDPQRQYEIARSVHVQQHGGINKTTATIAEKYHWVRIKETVSLVIRNCADCKELAKAPIIGGPKRNSTAVSPVPAANAISAPPASTSHVSAAGRILSLSNSGSPSARQTPVPASAPPAHPGMMHPHGVPHQLQQQHMPQPQHHPTHFNPHQQPPPLLPDFPLDPQIMEDVQHHLSSYSASPHPSDPTGHPDTDLALKASATAAARAAIGHIPTGHDPHHTHPDHHHDPDADADADGEPDADADADADAEGDPDADHEDESARERDLKHQLFVAGFGTDTDSYVG